MTIDLTMYELELIRNALEWGLDDGNGTEEEVRVATILLEKINQHNIW